MRSTEVEVIQPQSQAIQTRETVAGIKARVQLVQQVMRSVMKPGVHYGTIPDTPKPTLYQPGAEIIGLAFQFGPRYVVDDLTRLPEVVRYRLTCELYSQETGAFVGSGIGEASSDEEKYRWRKAVCKEEFEATPEDRRRVKWAKGRERSVYTVDQVRMEPADIANTVLKMGKKRAFVDAIRSASACSDMFSQDLEDMSTEVRQAVTGEERAAMPKTIGPRNWKKLVGQAQAFGYSEEDLTATAATAGFEGAGQDITEDLAKRLYQAMKAAPKTAAAAPAEAAQVEQPEFPPAKGYTTFPNDDDIPL